MKAKPLCWHGGKHFLAKWILSNFPARDRYTHYNEAFAGGLHVLFAHDPEGKSEAVNDLNRGLSDFWYVLANTPEPLLRQLWLTPLSQEIWEESKSQIVADTDRVRRATAFFIRYRQSRQGRGKCYRTPSTRTARGMNENVSSWLSAIDGLPEAHERLRSVEVRNMDAIRFIREYDHPKALFYLDPPYLHSTRNLKNAYECEMSIEAHVELLDCISDMEGMFILSGYPSELYSDYAAKKGWRTATKEIDKKSSSSPTKEIKTEVLWMNY
jgi:DNA adenine methylase